MVRFLIPFTFLSPFPCFRPSLSLIERLLLPHTLYLPSSFRHLLSSPLTSRTPVSASRYGFFFFADPLVERWAKRFMRDRVRYLDIIPCAAGKVIDHLRRDVHAHAGTADSDGPFPLVAYADSSGSASGSGSGHGGGDGGSGGGGGDGGGGGGSSAIERPPGRRRVYRLLSPRHGAYIAYHIRRGDFQQKHTRLAAEDIVRLTLPLVPGNASAWTAYIATDEKNRSFFRPFFDVFGAVKFLGDYLEKAGLAEMNQNHLGMVEQIVCANAHTFIGTPLSTFTGFITRMRGFMNRTTVAALPLASPLTAPLPSPRAATATATAPAPAGGDGKQGKNGHGKAAGKNQGLDLDVSPPTHTGRPIVALPPTAAPSVGRTASAAALPAPIDGAPVAVGLYERTFYFMKKFTYQLQERPHLELPFWVRVLFSAGAVAYCRSIDPFF